VDPVAVDRGACVRCAACAVVAPAVFSVSRRGVEVRAQPETGEQRTAARAASMLCPAQAITVRVP